MRLSSLEGWGLFAAEKYFPPLFGGVQGFVAVFQGSGGVQGFVAVFQGSGGAQGCVAFTKDLVESKGL